MAGMPERQVSWNIFDGMLTRGKVVQTKALYDKAKTELGRHRAPD